MKRDFFRIKGKWRAVSEDIGNCSLLFLFIVGYSIFSMSL